MKVVINAVRAVLTVVVFFALFATWIVAWICQKVATLCMLPFASKTQIQDVCARIFRTLNMITMDLAHPMWRTNIVKKFDASKLPKGRPVIFMINHLSNSDPWTCIRVLWPVDCKWICKGSLFKVPFGGWCLENAGDLAVRFTAAKDGWGTEKGSVRTLMEDAAGLLRRGQPIAVFPEGVRSFTPEGDLNEFKAGFFDLAIKEGAVIVPVALSGTHRMWPRGDWKFGFATAYSAVGDYIETKGMESADLVKLTRDTIAKMRDELPDRKAAKKSQ